MQKETVKCNLKEEKTLNRLKDFDDNFGDDELNLKTRGILSKRKRKMKNFYRKIESNSSYNDKIQNLECTNFGLFIKSHTDFFQQMVLDVKFTIPKVNNSEQKSTP